MHCAHCGEDLVGILEFDRWTDRQGRYLCSVCWSKQAAAEFWDRFNAVAAEQVAAQRVGCLFEAILVGGAVAALLLLALHWGGF